MLQSRIGNLVAAAVVVKAHSHCRPVFINADMSPHCGNSGDRITPTPHTGNQPHQRHAQDYSHAEPILL
ncbi:MAG: hypothetical protein VYD81_04665 [Planctomycetota bacterium]|nr:hypothetical protein [Planctomycetota bacterium]